MCRIISSETQDAEHRSFWSNMSRELFLNVRELYEQIDAQFSVRSAGESVGAQMTVSIATPIFLV
jgi:hypothetical protein